MTEAVCQQLATLNTNSRYLHPTLTAYSTELLSTMPPSLQVGLTGGDNRRLCCPACRRACSDGEGCMQAVLPGMRASQMGAECPACCYVRWGWRLERVIVLFETQVGQTRALCFLSSCLVSGPLRMGPA